MRFSKAAPPLFTFFSWIGTQHSTAPFYDMWSPSTLYIRHHGPILQWSLLCLRTNQSTSYFLLMRGARQCCPLSPCLFIIVLAARTADLHSSFETLFGYVRWTYSPNHPFTDLEFADDTILMARTPETLHRILHVQQHLEMRMVSFLTEQNVNSLLFTPLSPSLSIYLSLYISLSIITSLTPHQPCSCPHCASAYGLHPDPSSLGEPISRLCFLIPRFLPGSYIIFST